MTVTIKMKENPKEPVKPPRDNVKILSRIVSIVCILIMVTLMGFFTWATFNEQKDQEIKRNAEIKRREQGIPRDVNKDSRFSRVTYDGHTYIVFSCYRQYGITHDPDCECHKEASETSTE